MALRVTCVGSVLRWGLCVVALAGRVGGSWAGAEDIGEPESRWEDSIRAFEEEDRTAGLRCGGVVFTGSSSIRKWATLDRDFPGARPLNRGFGGSEFSDLVRYVDRVILPYRPRVLVVYSGDNDIKNGKVVQAILADFETLSAIVHAVLPDCRIGVIAVKPSPARWKFAGEMGELNAGLRAHAEAHAHVTFIDVWTPMLLEAGEPDPSLFDDDDLHLNERGYRLWAETLRPFVFEARVLRDPGARGGRIRAAVNGERILIGWASGGVDGEGVELTVQSDLAGGAVVERVALEPGRAVQLPIRGSRGFIVRRGSVPGSGDAGGADGTCG